MKRVNSVSHDANRRSDRSKLNLFIILVLAAFFTIAIVVGSFYHPNITGNVISVFDGNPVSAVRGGLWNDQATWSSNRVPTASDSVIIDGNKVVEVNTNAVAKDIRVTNGATLKASRTVSSRLDVSGSISVTTGSTIDYGRQSDPIPAGIQAIIGFNVADDRLFNGNAVPDNFIAGMPDYQPEDTGLWVVGTGSSGYFYGASKNFVWTKLTGDARSGTTVLNISGVVTGWMPGDTVLISSTSNDADESETGVIASVGGNKVTLRDPLKYTHEGNSYSYNATTNIPMKGEVALLTQNVRVQSNLVKEGDTHHRAHTIWMHGATGGIGYTEFRDLGTRGKMGRYSIHLHKNGNAGSTFVIQGASIWQSTTDPGNKWVVIHTSNGVTVKDSAGYLAQGRGYYLEDGDEINVVLKNNLGVKAVSPEELPNTVVPLSFQPKEGSAAFWVREGNTVENNVAAGGKGAAGIWITPNRNAAATTTSIKGNEVHSSDIGIFVTGENKNIATTTNSLLWRNVNAFQIGDKVTTTVSGASMIGNGRTSFDGKLVGNNLLAVRERTPYIIIDPRNNPAWTNTKNYVLNYTFFDGLNSYNRQRTFSLNEGYNELNITEVSIYGEKVNEFYPVRIDTVVPIINIPSNLNPTSVSDSEYILRYTLNDGSMYQVNKFKEFNLQNGANTLTINDEDFSGNKASATYVVTLNPKANTAPVISNVNSSYTIIQGDVLRIPIKVDDADNDILNYSLQYLVNNVPKVTPRNVYYYPTVLNIYEAGQRYSTGVEYLEANVFTWSPNVSQTGAYTFKFKAVDEKGAISEKTFTVNVNPYTGEAPWINVKGQVDSNVQTPPYQNGETIVGSSPSGTEGLSDSTIIKLRIETKDLQGDTYTVDLVKGADKFDRYVFSNDTTCKLNGCRYFTFRTNETQINATIRATDSKGNYKDFNFNLELFPPAAKVSRIYTNPSGSLGIKTTNNKLLDYGHSYELFYGVQPLYVYRDVPKTYTSNNGYPVEYRYTLDGVPISPILNRSDVFNFNTALYPDGQHILSLKIIDAEDIPGYVIENYKIVINNQPGGVDKPGYIAYAAPEVGRGVQTEDDSHSAVDKIYYPGQRQHTPGHPYPYVFSPPVNTRTDPMSVLGANNWFMESLTATLNYGPAGDDFTQEYVKNDNGDVIIRQRGLGTYPTDGPRGDNELPTQSQYTADPEQAGWYGIDRDLGRLYKVSPEGEVNTIAGRVYRRDIILPITVNAANIDSLTLKVGDFENGLMFNNPGDLYFDTRDHKILYVADTGNQRIAKVDLHGAVAKVSTLVGIPNTAGYVDGAKNIAKFNQPSSLVVDWRDNSIYVADKLNGAIRRVYPNGTVTTVVSSRGNYNGNITLSKNIWPNVPAGIGKEAKQSSPTGFVRFDIVDGVYTFTNETFTKKVSVNVSAPVSVKLDSEGNLIIGEGCTESTMKFNQETQSLDVLFSLQYFTGGINGRTCILSKVNQVWAEPDFRGNVGPRDDILFTVAAGGRGIFPGTYSVNWFRVSNNGERAGGLFFDQAFGSGQSRGPKGYSDGPASAMFAPGGIVPWTIAIDDEESKILLRAATTSGITIARPVRSGDATSPDIDLYRSQVTSALLNTGSVLDSMGQEYRPSFSILHGSTGQTDLGNMPDFEDLAILSDQKLADYIQSGFGGVVQRPEFVGSTLNNFIYFVRRNSVYGNTKPIPLPVAPSDNKNPEVRNIVVTPLSDTSAKINFVTDEPTFAFAYYGSTPAEGLITADDWNGKTHEIILTDLPSGKKIYYSIFASDMASNYIRTKGDSFTLQQARSCSAQGGKICSNTETCSGNYASSSDSGSCCIGSCTTTCIPNWRAGTWSACTDGKQTRTLTDSACGLPSTTETIDCSGTTPNPTPTSCTPTYSEWSACVNGQQTRTVVSVSPAGCNPTSTKLTQTCDLDMIEIEAESFTSSKNVSNYNWTKTAGSSYSGGFAMITTPNIGSGATSNIPNTSPQLNYVVNFAKNGTYYVWMRGVGGGTDDSAYGGLDGNVASTYNTFYTKLVWSKTDLDNKFVTINVPTAGTHTINLWMREDGTRVDKIVLTQNPNFVPN